MSDKRIQEIQEEHKHIIAEWMKEFGQFPTFEQLQEWKLKKSLSEGAFDEERIKQDLIILKSKLAEVMKVFKK